MRCLTVLVVLMVVSVSFAEDEKDKKNEKEKPINVVEVVAWNKGWGQKLKETKNPLVRKDLQKKKQEEYNDKIKGKTVVGLGKVIAMSANDDVYLQVSVPIGVKENINFTVKVKDKDDPVLKKLVVGRDGSIVVFTGKLPDTAEFSTHLTDAVVEKKK
jgi:hypothetical protein